MSLHQFPLKICKVKCDLSCKFDFTQTKGLAKSKCEDILHVTWITTIKTIQAGECFISSQERLGEI